MVTPGEGIPPSSILGRGGKEVLFSFMKKKKDSLIFRREEGSICGPGGKKGGNAASFGWGGDPALNSL